MIKLDKNKNIDPDIDNNDIRKIITIKLSHVPRNNTVSF